MEPHHPVKKSSSQVVVIGTALGTALLVLIAVIWLFGSSHEEFGARATLGSGAGGDAGVSRSDEPTLVYRDTGGGRVLVLEIGPNGTRVKGTMDKADVPMAGNLYREERKRSFETPSASERFNAMGSAFH